LEKCKDREKNKEQIAAQKKVYKEMSKEQRVAYRKASSEKHKQGKRQNSEEDLAERPLVEYACGNQT
jgi:hypothetical protein